MAICGYRPQYLPSDYLLLWPRFADAGHSILTQPAFLTHYRIHSDSICCGQVRRTLKRVPWVRECMVRRRRGQPEITWERFLEYDRTLPLMRRIDNERKLT